MENATRAAGPPWKIAWVLALGTLLATAGASAQEPTVEAEGAAAASEDTRPTRAALTAQGLFEAGRDAFQAGRFEVALDLFHEAYDTSESHLLLYSIAQTNDRLERDAAALDAFERYLTLVPEPPYATEVQARIVSLRAATLTRGEAAAAPAPVIEQWWFWAAVVAGAAMLVTAVAIPLAFLDGDAAQPSAGDVGGVIFTLRSR